MSDLTTFQDETRAWLDSNCPASMRVPANSTDEIEWGGRRRRDDTDDKKIWLDRMASQGWICPQWPEEYGGAGLDAEQAKVLAQEMRRIDARRTCAPR